MGRKGERARDRQRQSPTAAASLPATGTLETVIGESTADQAALLQRLPAAQAQDLLQRAGAVQGNTHARAVAGAAALQRAPLLDDDMLDLVMDGVQAFEQLASSPITGAPPPPPPPVPSLTPPALRPALGHLRAAKQHVVRSNPGMAQAAVGARLNAEGPLGIAKMIFLGPRLVLDERIEQAYAAKAEWQSARGTCKALVDRYSTTPGAAANYADQLQGLISRLDLEMTAEIPKLHDMLIQMTSPEEAEVARTVAEAKQAVSCFEKIVDHVGRVTKVHKESEIVWKDRQLGMKFTRPGIGPMPESTATKDLLKEDLTAEEEAFHFEISESQTSSTFDKGLAGLKTLKSLISFYESGKAIGAAAFTLGDDRASGVAKTKAALDITSNLLTPVQEAGSLIFKGSAEILQTIAEARREMGRYGTAYRRDPFLRQAAYLFETAEGLRKWAGWLDKLEKVTGVLGIVTGALGMIEAVSTDDVEGTIGGGLDVVTGVAGMAAPGAVATGLGIGALQIKGMMEAVAQMSRSLQTIRNQRLRAAANLVAEELNAAATHVRVFDDAWQEWAARQGTPDQLETGLAQQFGNSALRQVGPLQVALHNGLLRALDGGLNTYPVLVDEFCQPFGGYAAVRALTRDLAARPGAASTGELVTQAEFLKEIVRPMAIGVSNLSMALAALDREAKGKVEFAEAARNTLEVSTTVRLDYGAPTISDVSVALDTPIDDQAYKDVLAARAAGKTLGQLRDFNIELSVKVIAADPIYRILRLTLIGSDDGLVRHEGVGQILDLVGEAVGGGPPAETDAAQTLWREHLRRVTVPEGIFG